MADDLTQGSDETTRIPDLIRIGTIGTDQEVSVDTEILEPVVSNQNFARFLIPAKGFLHSFSKLQIGVNACGNTPLATLPAGIGVHSLIERCQLKIGNSVVSEQSDFGAWMQYKSMFVDNEINLEKETYETSRVINHDFHYRDKEDDQSDGNASGYALAGNRAVNQTDVSYDALPCLQNENEALFSISLADMFEFLQWHQLNLYMIDQPVTIEIFFKSAVSLGRMCLDETEKAQTGALFDIDLTELKFVCDIIYYDGDTMQRYAEQNRSLTWDYVDYRLRKWKKFIREIN